MTRVAAAFWILLVLASGFATFKVKYAVQDIEDQLNQTRKQTIAEQQEIRVLNAEWTYLNQPERLADLNRRFIGLVPISAPQLQERIDQIAFRAPVAPPSMAYRMVAAAVPPSAPQPRVVAAAPAAAAVPAVQRAEAGQPTSLDALIAQIEPAPAAGTSPARTAAQAATPASAMSLDGLISQIEPVTAAEAKPIPAATPAGARAELAKESPRSLDSLIARIVEKP